MSYYIKMADQRDMLKICQDFMKESDSGTRKTTKGDMLMQKFFENYADKIIKGIIYAPQYRYYQFAELDDLISEGRMAIYLSVINEQWDPNRGASFFSFLSTVVSRNLRSFTLKLNRHRKYKSDQEIETVYNNPNMTYIQDYDKKFIMNDLFCELRKYFDGRDKFIELTDLLEFYFNNVIKPEGKKFIKKEFIEFAKGYAYSPSLINTFFSHIKRIKSKKDLLLKDIY